MMQEKDTETADRIKRMVAELNEAMQQATDDGLVLKVHTVEGANVGFHGIGLMEPVTVRTLPSLYVEIVRPL